MKKPQLLLHIGTFKTGTTALQDALAAQSRTLASKGVLYHGWKDDGLNRNHSFLAALLVTDEGRAPVTQFFADLARECERSDADRAVVSAEGFYALEFVDEENWAVRPPLKPKVFSRSRKEYIQRLRECIGDAFDAKIVVYLRRQDYFLNSLYNQLVKDVFAYAGTIREFARDWGVLGDYGLMLDLWAGPFGAEAVVARIYESLQGAPDIVPGFFADVLGLPEPEMAVHPAPQPQRGNLALPWDLLEYKRILNRRFRGISFEEKKKLRDDLMLLAGRSREARKSMMLLPADERLSLLLRYANSDHHVAEQYLGGAGPLFKEPAPVAGRSHEELLELSVERAVEIGVELNLLEQHRPREESGAAKKTGWQRWRREWFRRREGPHSGKAA